MQTSIGSIAVIFMGEAGCGQSGHDRTFGRVAACCGYPSSYGALNLNAKTQEKKERSQQKSDDGSATLRPPVLRDEAASTRTRPWPPCRCRRAGARAARALLRSR